MARIPGLISKKTVELAPIEKAKKVSYEAFDAFRAAQAGLDESNAILEDHAQALESQIEYLKGQIAESNAQVSKNNSLAVKLAEFTG